MNNTIERNLGEQPIANIIIEHKLTKMDIISASKENITFKMLSKACNGRRLNPHIQRKICNAFNNASGQSFAVEDLFNY